MYKFKGAEAPEISLLYLQDTYRIYKLKVSSLVKKYQIRATFNDILLEGG